MEGRQAGGHAKSLRVDGKGRLYKLLKERERDFLRLVMTSKLQPFTPDFYGEVVEDGKRWLVWFASLLYSSFLPFYVLMDRTDEGQRWILFLRRGDNRPAGGGDVGNGWWGDESRSWRM